ncbi:MAG TPA: hypothetical protein VF733_06350 [Candidatus Saccharimonadales bacterium]
MEAHQSSPGPSPVKDSNVQRGSELPLSQQESERQARINYLKSLNADHNRQESPRRRRLWLIIVSVILLAAVGTAAWFLLVKKEPAKPTTTAKQSQNQMPESEDPAAPLKTKHYDSTTFNLGFDYPDDWVVSEVDGRLLVSSKAIKLKSASGQNLNGRIQVLIQPKQTTIKDFAKGNGVAMLDSEKITYTKPTQTQRAQTYLSFVNYPSSSAQGIDAIYITGDIGYQKDQAVPMVDIVRVDPLITASFMQCPNEACSGAVAPLTLAATEWTGKVIVGKSLKTILTTLSIQ